MGIWRQIAKPILPIPEPDIELNPDNVFQRYHNALANMTRQAIATNIGNKVLELSKYLFEEEEKRRSNIMKMATNILGYISISSALVAGLTTLIFGGQLKISGLSLIGLLGCYILFVLYMLGAAITALWVFRADIRSCLGPDDLPPDAQETEENYIRRISGKFMEYTISNYKVDNRARARVESARSCVRNAVILIVIAILLVVIHVSNRSDFTNLNL